MRRREGANSYQCSMTVHSEMYWCARDLTTNYKFKGKWVHVHAITIAKQCRLLYRSHCVIGS